MRLVRQRTATTCGQCVIAMLFNVSRRTAIEMIGHSGITSDEEMLNACRIDGGFTDGTPPNDVIAVQKHKDPNGTQEHWTLWNKGEVLDPRGRPEELWPVYKYFVVSDEHTTELKKPSR